MNLYKIFAITLALFCNIHAIALANEDVDPTAESSTYYKKFKYETSLAYTQISGSQWWTKIEPYNIYLGALPLKNKGHLDQILSLGVTGVLSLVEDFEQEDGWFNKPVKGEDWQKNGVNFVHVPAADFLPLTRSQIETGVNALAQMLDEGRTVYVHCKAGRGRSATIVIVYLMQSQGLTFDEAFTFIKDQRSQINLNKTQSQAIFDFFDDDQSEVTEQPAKSWLGSVSPGIYGYFENQNFMTEEKLAKLLDDLLYYVIEGVSYSPDETLPECLSGWIPAIQIESTLSRRNRYLREYNGDQDAATEASIIRNHTLSRRFKLFAAGAVPLIGIPTGYSVSLWHQLREIALIAAIHGHDIRDPQVKMKMLSALAGGNMLKIPAATVDLVARRIVKKIILQAGIKGITSSAIPAHLIFNFFSDNSAKVSTHAKALFAGEHSILIPAEEYFVNDLRK